MTSDDIWDSLMEEKTPKDLLKLLIKRDDIGADDAASALSVDRKIIDEWANALSAKRYVEYVNQDPRSRTLRLTSEFKQTLNRMRQKQNPTEIQTQAQKSKIDELSGQVGELAKTKDSLEAQLEEKSSLAESLAKDLSEEKQMRSRFQEEFERQRRIHSAKFEETVNTLQKSLERERAERLKLEDIIRKIRSKEVEATSKTVEETLVESAKFTTQEPILKVNIHAPEPEPQAIEKQPESSSVSKPESKPPEQEQAKPKAQEELKQPSLDEREAMLKLLGEKKCVTQTEAAQALGWDDARMQLTLDRLQADGTVETKRRLFGAPQFKIKDGIDLNQRLQEIQNIRLKQEIARMMGRR